MEPHLVLGIGELLWDVRDEESALDAGPLGSTLERESLGGAPANFSVMAGRLGNHSVLLSRIGRDELGRRAVARLDPLPADASNLQVDPVHETGRVTVSLKEGQPCYTIHEPAAWDFLELSDSWVQLATRANVLCFGSLAQRSHESRQTIQTLAAQAKSSCIRIFDVNLRAPFYSSEVLQESMELATVLKMNDAEVPLVLDLLGLPVLDGPVVDQLRAGAQRLLSEFPVLQMVAVTRGGEGSLLMTREECHEHPGRAVKVADTIGAGDAFTAALAHFMLRGANLATMNEAGNRWGGWVASQVGAMPELPEETLAGITAEIASGVHQRV